MIELTSKSATQLVEMMRRRQVSPVEVAQAHLDRIDRVNPQLNALVTLAPNVLEEARTAEAAIMRNDARGELLGLPITIKDTIETAGLRSTSGSARRKHYVPERDATAVARLKAAGAIILGKTNTAEMAMDYTADNPVFGRTNSPHDLSRTPGGSSGGEAAAIAVCMSPCGIGSDLAGSIRIPAHFCGITGLKPSTNRVPGEGQCPPSVGPYSLGSAIGPMARTVRDVRLLFKVLSGSKATAGDEQEEGLRGCRVAWYTDDGVSPVTPEIAKAVENAAKTLADAGLKVDEQRPPAVECGNELWLKLFSRASVVQLRDVYTGREEETGDFVRWRLQTADDAPAATLDEYIHAWSERDRLRANLIEWMQYIPLLLAPVGATAALEHGARKVTVAGKTFGSFRAFSYSQTFNVFDLPAISVPAGYSQERLPIGVQVIGRAFAEELVLAAAEIIEQALGGWRMPAMFDKAD